MLSSIVIDYKKVLEYELMKNNMSEDRSPGWKTRQMEREYTEIAVNFVDALHAQGFLKLEFDSSDEHIEKILKRLTATSQSFGKLYDIVSDTEKFPSFRDAIEPFGFSGDDMMRIFTGMFAHCKLEEFEFLKTIMLMITEKKEYGIDRRGNPKEIRGGETLGQLLAKFDEFIPDNKIRDIVNNKLRTVLGHGKWWTKSFHFCFVDKNGVEQEYDIAELLLEGIQIATFTRIFYEKGFERATAIKRELV